jgi:tetratricopeptide (TPR) repeat protein
MATIPEVMAQGWAHHREGRLSRAVDLYRRVLRDDPDHVDAGSLYGAACQALGHLPEAEAAYEQVLRLRPDRVEVLGNLGLIRAAQGRWEGAADAFRRALALRPDLAVAAKHLGRALTELGRPDEAQAVLGHALRLGADDPEVHYILGRALMRRGDSEGAAASYRRALSVKPDFDLAHHRLGEALQEQGRWSEAAESYRDALRFRPDLVEAHVNLGNALRELGDREGAAASYRCAVHLKPDYALAHNNLGNILRELGRPEEAEESCRLAVRLSPDFAEAHDNLGNALRDQGRLEEAIASYRRALCLKPDSALSCNNLGNALREMGRLDEAAASFEGAIRLRPDYAEAHATLAMLRLLAGDFERGWPGYEWRFRTWGPRYRDGAFPSNPSRRLLWDGSPLEGRTILLHAEQGLGDTIQFVRFATMVHERGGVVILECQPGLRTLLAGCPGVDRVVAPGEPRPEFAVHAPLLSLPGILGTTMDTIPAPVPYLRAEDSRVARWRRELGGLPGFRVGIVWGGNPEHRNDRRRSIPPDRFVPLAETVGVRLVGLQKGPGAERWDETGRRPPILDLGGRLEDFADTAAVLANLDLLISCDTAVVHLAGALGVPAWVALPSDPDWRWLLGRDDSPWYPSLRLFRQDRPGDWAGVFERIAVALRGAL